MGSILPFIADPTSKLTAHGECSSNLKSTSCRPNMRGASSFSLLLPVAFNDMRVSFNFESSLSSCFLIVVLLLAFLQSDLLQKSKIGGTRSSMIGSVNTSYRNSALSRTFVFTASNTNTIPPTDGEYFFNACCP